MTFDLTPELSTAVERARRVRESHVSPAAADIDRSGQIPAGIVEAAEGAVDWAQSPLAAVLAIEELAVASASVAARAAVGAGPTGQGLAGLRGVGTVESPTDQQQLGLAAVCVGLGRAALDDALGVLRTRGDRPSGDPAEAPHWVLADAATEVDAARLLVHGAAQGGQPGPAAALVFAGRAALQAVEAAIRQVGADALAPGALLERYSRDARSALLVLGTEDQARRRAGDVLLG